MAYSKFSNDIKKFVESVKAKSNLTVKEVILGCGASLIDKSPIGDPLLWKPYPAAANAAYARGYVGGRFKANWVGGINEINTLITDDIDPTGEVSMTAILSAIPENPVGSIFYITNSLPYAKRLEDGWSNQAPSGMVGLTVAEFNQIVDAATARVSVNA